MIRNIVEIAEDGDKMRGIFWFVIIFYLNLIADQDASLDSIVINRIAGDLFFRDNFIFTFHGLKPVSYGVCVKPTDWREVIYQRSNYYAWKKWKKTLSNDTFLFLEEPSPFSEHDVSIFIINKYEYLKCTNEHLALFKKFLGSDFNPSKVLCDLALQKTTFRKSIKNNEMLFGILLGYGEQNSNLYQQNCYGHPKHLPRKIQKTEYIIIGPDPSPLGLITPCRCLAANPNLHDKFTHEYLWLCKKYAHSNTLQQVVDILNK